MVNWIVAVANAPTRCFCSSLHDIFGDAVFPTTVVPELVSAIGEAPGYTEVILDFVDGVHKFVRGCGFVGQENFPISQIA